MPLKAPASFTALKNQLLQGDEWIWLYECRSPTGGPILAPDGTQSILRVTAHSVPVPFGADAETGAPLVWKPWPVKLGEITDDSRGNINDIQLTFANAAASATALLVDNDYLRNHQVIIRLVNAGLLDDAGAVFEIRTTVVDATISWEAIALRLSAFAFLDFSVPQVIMARKCRFAYRDGQCGFVGDPGNATLGPCVFSLEACEARGAYEEANGLQVIHPGRFGGYPSLLAGPVVGGLP